ncbi:MAG: hypothetical protein SH850_16840 [Planctomycetaceae bacterium]|nr:hypothetical protein [Planctomycetaceae bacterium]
MTVAIGVLITAWTARLAVACYLARIAIDAAGRTDDAAQRIARGIWTAGLAIFLLHIAAAFQFHHHWSHAAALEHVRQQTRTLTGWDSGIGLFINYGFTLLWAVDCGLWWRSLHWSRQRLSYWYVQVIFAFLMLNATVVFGPRGWIAVGAVVAIGLSILAWRRKK